MSTAFGDARTVPATAEAKNLLKQLAKTGLFKEQRDVWQLGAAWGIRTGKAYTEGKRETYQNINSLDPESLFAAVMLGRYPDLTPEQRLKKLVDHAEWGVREINRRYANATLDLSTLASP